MTCHFIHWILILIFLHLQYFALGIFWKWQKQGIGILACKKIVGSLMLASTLPCCVLDILGHPSLGSLVNNRWAMLWILGHWFNALPLYNFLGRVFYWDCFFVTWSENAHLYFRSILACFWNQSLQTCFTCIEGHQIVFRSRQCILFGSCRSTKDSKTTQTGEQSRMRWWRLWT